MSEQYEVRCLDELRATDEGKLVGYAAVWNARSHDLGGFVEQVDRHAFDRTLRENPDVLALVDHDMSKVLGRTSNGTLRIEPDEHGLRVEIAPADTSYTRDLLTLIRGKFVGSMSFRFKPYPGGAKLDMSQNPPVRTLESVRLVEVSVVTRPAYEATTVSVRSLEEARANSVGNDMRHLRLRLAEIDN